MQRLTAAVACLVAALALASCGGGSGGGSGPNTTKRSTTSAAAASDGSGTGSSTAVSNASATPLTASATAPSVAGVTRDLDRLYQAHPDLTKYVVQSTTYSTHSRDVVLRACTSGGTAATSQQVQSSRLIACSPLIFFYYSYGTQRHAPDATRVADELFSFASEEVRGPLNAPAELETLLHAWGITVDTSSVPAAKSLLTPKETTLLAQVERAILSKGSVRVTISGYQQKGRVLVERIAVDMSGQVSNESITEPAAHATIAVTPASAFVSGSSTGLTKLIGLPSAAAEKAGSRWIEVTKGSREYTDLAAEDTIAALPSTILPGTSDVVTLETTSHDGQPVEVLTWSAAESNSTGTLTEHLELAGGADPLPISESTSVGSDLQTVTFARWGEHVAALAPPAARVVSYASVTSR